LNITNTKTCASIKIRLTQLFLLALLTLGLNTGAFAEWPNQFGLNDGSLRVRDMAVDTDANTIIVGDFNGTISFPRKDDANLDLVAQGNSNIFVVKYSPVGDLIWAKSTALNGSVVLVDKVTVDDSDDIYMHGSLKAPRIADENGVLTRLPVLIGTTEFKHDVRQTFIAKMNSEGSILWAEAGRLDSRFLRNGYVAMGVAKSGDAIFTSGAFETDLFDAAYIQKFNKNKQSLGIHGLFVEGLHAYSANISGDIYNLDTTISGRKPLYIDDITVINANSYAVLMRLASNYVLCGAQRYSNRSYIVRYTETVDSTGVVTGQTCDWMMEVHSGGNKIENNGNSIFYRDHNYVSRIDSGSGTIIYEVNIPNEISDSLNPGFAVDADNNVYVSGGYDRPLDLSAAGGPLLPDPGNVGVFVAKLLPNGTWEWVNNASQTIETNVGSARLSSLGQVAVDNAGYLRVAANFTGTLKLGDTTSVVSSDSTVADLETFFAKDAFVALMDANGGNWLIPLAWEVGQVITKPLSTSDAKPQILIGGQSIANEGQYFYWNELTSELYAVSPAPGVVTIKWIIDDTVPPQEQQFITIIGAPVLPEISFRESYVEGSTVLLETAYAAEDPNIKLEFSGIQYPSGAEIKLVKSDNPELGKSFRWVTEHNVNSDHVVLRYTNPQTNATLLQVVNFKAESDVDTWESSNQCTIGTELTNATHDVTIVGRNGYLPNDLARYDASLHNVTTGVGPIIPVNKRSSDTDRLRVIWYSANDIGQHWADTAIEYTCSWPASTSETTITISDQKGSIPLGFEVTDATIYHQPNLSLPGYNPNEEHALILEKRVFALRSDLNAVVAQTPQAASDAYVLLKYLNSNTSQWAFNVYSVQAESTDSPWPIDQNAIAGNEVYSQVVGKQVKPPRPLVISACVDRLVKLDENPEKSAFLDYKGAFWASAAGSASFQYYYALQDNFYYDLDSDGEPDRQAGECVAWQNRMDGPRTTSETSVPTNVAFNFVWPDAVPVLRPGETLFSSKEVDCAPGPGVNSVDIAGEKCYLPKINGNSAVQIAFDETAAGVGIADSLVKLIDPLSARSVSLPVLKSDIATTSLNSKKIFTELPFVLRSRLSYDEINKTLVFIGRLNGEGQVGDPQLLPNIMTSFERNKIKSLPGTDSNFEEAVDALYHLTRNPDELNLDADPDALADQTYLVGLQAKEELWAIDETNDGIADNFIDVDNDLGQNKPDYKDDRIDLYNWTGDDTGLLDVPEGWNRVRADNKSDAVPQALLGTPMALTAGRPSGTGYVTLVFNNDKSLGSAPVSLRVLRVGIRDNCDVYQGNVWIVPSDNIFEEKLTLRHTGDFAGDPDNISFEWWYQPDDAGQPAAPSSDNQLTAPGSLWSRFPLGSNAPIPGQLDITLENTDPASALLVLSDNWFITRYTGLDACDNNAEIDLKPSAWAGDPSQPASAPRAMLGMGWIKRVITGLNPFDARVSDFHASEVNTLTSMIAQAGEPYSGPIPLNPDPDNVNNIGIIEAYQTIFERGMDLSINQGSNSIAANTQLLNVSTRISDLYMLLGNEAYADAQDPTIGFDTGSEVGTLASSIFAFQNQLNSPLEEELVLLRGRDDARAGIAAHPVNNRLFWNFTQGTGEVAYVQSYGIGDQNLDGFINETDARIRYPQGHGDAWGHYLTSVKNRYQLLREENFTWVPRAESVIIAGAPIEIDYMDERKFASAAAAKAKAGVEIINLTYREKYVEAPAGQWQGYKDTNTDRGWGVDGWGRRAGQGAYLDWAMANAILPAVDPDPNHEGIEKIDRTTVKELSLIVSGFNSIQAKIDESDAGLNPLGLAKGVVPFDIDPNFNEVGSGIQGQTHFDQIAKRAQVALDNALRVFDHANQQTQSLRNVQDDVDQIDRLVVEQEQDYKHRLIEIFGYPYAGDMGGGKTYPSDYDGPDIYHYMYVNSDLTGDLPPPDGSFTGFYSPIDFGGETISFGGEFAGEQGFFFPSDSISAILAIGPGGRTVSVEYPTTSGADWKFIAPEVWSQRRAPGELQSSISDLLQAQSQLQRAITEHSNLLRDIEDAADLVEAEFDFRLESIGILEDQRDTVYDLTVALGIAKATQITANRTAEKTLAISAITRDSIPTVTGLATDAFAAARAAIKGVGYGASTGFSVVSDVAELTEFSLNEAKDNSTFLVELSLLRDTTNVALIERVKELEQIWRQEAVLRLELFTQAEVVKQSAGRYYQILAKGQRLLEERATFRTLTAGDTQELRYRDMTFRIFRNDALQKYRASFDLAARYVYLAAKAYDYETNLLGDEPGSGRAFFEDIVRQRSLGQVIDGVPVAGTPGLADVLARLTQNFDVYRGQLGFNNPQIETNRFSLRNELFRKRQDPSDANSELVRLETAEEWRQVLEDSRVANLWDIPEFRRYARPFATESQDAQPGLVIRFPTSINFGTNFFGHALGGGDSAYDPTNFATKIRGVGTWFKGYDGAALSNTPRVYLLPVGMDVLRSPSDDSLSTREWRVIDQKLPVPFPIGNSDLSNPDWIPMNDSLSGTYADIRRHSSYRAYHDSGAFDSSEIVSDSRLIGRSVWNTDWMLIIPGGTLLFDSDEGLDRFINGQILPGQEGETNPLRDGTGISDILLNFQTYGYSGN
jgi:hypothetical protein